MKQAIARRTEGVLTRWAAALLTAAAIAGGGMLAGIPAHGATASGNAAAGKALYAKQGCAACHKIGGKGGKVGPDLSAEGTKKRPASWLVAFFKSPNSKFPKGTMPPVTGSPKDLQDLAAYMLTLKN